MNFVAAAVAIALGSFAATEFIKTIVPWTLQPWTKMALMAVIVAVGTYAYGLPSLVGVGAAGGALVVHRLHRFLGAAGDHHMIEVMRIDPRSGRPR